MATLGQLCGDDTNTLLLYKIAEKSLIQLAHALVLGDWLSDLSRPGWLDLASNDSI